MKTKTNRLFFIDAMRAWAILMMLQGHFIDGLLDPVFRDKENIFFSVWLYFRGITAPVFFTVSGFIFTYLLIKTPQRGFENPRIRKGIRRGLQLLLIGYLLRMNLFGILIGEIYDSFYLVDVLHCIGLSILALIGIYLFSIKRKKYLFPSILLGATLVLFLFEPLYNQWSFSFLPQAIANYFTKANGSVFTIIPWLGYATLGGFVSTLFYKFRNYTRLYEVAIGSALVLGSLLIFTSSDVFLYVHRLTRIQLFADIFFNNYLFIRLGDVFIVFAVFMLLRRFMMNKTVLSIGSSTLSIYVIHFVILYGSFTGLGLYRFFNHILIPSVVVPGALAFMFTCTYLALRYNKHESEVKARIATGTDYLKKQSIGLYKVSKPMLREISVRVKLFLSRVFGVAK
ncbi:MAG: acyltransferase family protein [Bacteroidota bacterium]